MMPMNIVVGLSAASQVYKRQQHVIIMQVLRMMMDLVSLLQAVRHVLVR